MKIQFECPINALSFNNRGNRLAVAGKNFLKIVDVSDEKNFKELHNLKVGDQPRSLASSLDVSWNKVEVNRIATATGNGYIALWNLSRPEVNRVERIIRPKKQYAMKVCFHHSKPNYLLSATGDDCVVFFDLRQERSVFTFENRGAHVRDVKFAYNSHTLFALADDNGMVKFLDVRKPAKPVQLFTAHGGPVLSLDFNPLVENIFATGGRDKIIQIWEYQSTKTKLEDSIVTSAPVGQIHWNPLKGTQIASSALTTDFEIQVWDIRHPCLPYAVFFEHTSSVKGFQWKPNSDSLLSASTNGSLIWNNAKNAYQPCRHISPVAINFSVNGNILYVYDSHISNKKLGVASSTADDGEDRSNSYFVGPRKSCFRLLNSQFYKNKKTYITPAQFKTFAEEYHLTDYCFPDLCQHNANVALKLKKRRESHTWLMLKDFYISGHLTLVNLRRAWLRTKASCQWSSASDLSTDFYLESTQSDQGDQSEYDHFIACFGRLFDDDFERETYAPPSTRRPEDEKLPISKIAVCSEGFGASEETLAKPHCRDESAWLKMDFDLIFNQLTRSWGSSYNSHFINLTVDGNPVIIRWFDYMLLLQKIIPYFVENRANLQMGATMMLSLGKLGNAMVRRETKTEWLLSYTELLKRCEQYSTAVEVMKMCPTIPFRNINQPKNKIMIFCPHCEKPAFNKSWICNSCNRPLENCSVCEETIRGLFLWCPGCLHGGHLNHIESWFQSHNLCPTGCGHKCTYD
ncbi:WD repeat-containing protein 24 [Trichinella pseudospiralis]|uniref:GATOR2 complex protein WDR24 n=1 Tax=Trichinella pseudospiralis TaxID=6337 RepID=A0A0V1G421_TRIPS|nr:WD repeat-containing protein 24 [Trichinella pseudospiralis]